LQHSTDERLRTAAARWLGVPIALRYGEGDTALAWVGVGLARLFLLLPLQPVDPTAKHRTLLGMALARGDAAARELAARIQVW
jgi:hypothetical protein